jgi:hypothetical protein
LNLQKAREVLAYLNRLAVEDMASKPEMQQLRRRLLAKLIEYYQDFIDRHEEEAAADELHEAQQQVIELLDEVGRKADAWAAFERSLRDRPPQNRGGPGRPPPGPPRGIAPLVMLGQPAVHRELGLKPQQAEAVKAALDFGDRPPSDEEAARAEKALAKALSPGQSARLNQIILQSRGTQALLDHAVAHKLKLSGWQKEQIKKALEGGKPGRQPWRGPGGKGRWPGGKKPNTDEEALRVLNPFQRATWQGMVGKPFRIDMRPGPHPSRPPARGTATYSYYEGEWKHLPEFDQLEPVASGTGRAFDLGLARRHDNYGMRFEGFFKLDHDEECVFTLTSDDGSRLFIDGKQVVDNDGMHAIQTRQGRVKLKAGTHKVAVNYFQACLSAGLQVEVRGQRLGRHNLGDLLAATEAELDRGTGPRR